MRSENEDEEEGITVRDDMFSRLIQPPIANTTKENERRTARGYKRRRDERVFFFTSSLRLIRMAATSGIEKLKGTWEYVDGEHFDDFMKEIVRRNREPSEGHHLFSLGCWFRSPSIG